MVYDALPIIQGLWRILKSDDHSVKFLFLLISVSVWEAFSALTGLPSLIGMIPGSMELTDRRWCLFVLLGVLSGFRGLRFLYKRIDAKVEAWNAEERESKLYSQIEERITRFDSDELKIISEFFVQGKNQILLPAENGAVQQLRREGILVFSGDAISGFDTYFRLSDRLREMLEPADLGFNEDDIVDGSSPPRLRRDAALEAMNRRPKFLTDVARRERRRR